MNLLLFVHGGGFISGPNQLHWNIIEKLSKETKQTIWVCDYPKAPENDIMLSVKGVVSAKRMCAGRYDLDNVMISPINASFKNFPTTVLYLAENDITYADQQLLVNTLIKESVSHKIYRGEGMPHIWPYLPFMPESKNALKHIVAEINQTEGKIIPISTLFS